MCICRLHAFLTESFAVHRINPDTRYVVVKRVLRHNNESNKGVSRIAS